MLRLTDTLQSGNVGHAILSGLIRESNVIDIKARRSVPGSFAPIDSL